MLVQKYKYWHLLLVQKYKCWHLLAKATRKTFSMTGNVGGLYEAYVIITPSERESEKNTCDAAASNTVD
jgi:hypothetical protein